jgi:hypothetical protein
MAPPSLAIAFVVGGVAAAILAVVSVHTQVCGNKINILLHLADPPSSITAAAPTRCHWDLLHLDSLPPSPPAAPPNQQPFFSWEADQSPFVSEAHMAVSRRARDVAFADLTRSVLTGARPDGSERRQDGAVPVVIGSGR